MPLAEITDTHLQAFLDWIRSEWLDGTKRPLKTNTMSRSRAIVRAAFTNARKRRLIDWDPWDAVEPEQTLDQDKVDPDLVMDPAEVRRLAQTCAKVHPRYRAYVLVQGFCGLRPGEADTLRRRDVDLDTAPATVTVRGSISRVPDRFFTDGESRRRPLKRRGGKASRTIPIPAELVHVLRWHMDTFVAPGRDSLVFTNTKGRQIIQSNFTRDVWKKARAAAFEEDGPLRGVRRHDLRHAAITLWLNSGVPLKTAQRWSGHKTLSVLLNTYLGVMRTDEDVAVERVEEALAGAEEHEHAAGSEDAQGTPEGTGQESGQRDEDKGPPVTGS